jgi:hypothetical protein
MRGTMLGMLLLGIVAIADGVMLVCLCVILWRDCQRGLGSGVFAVCVAVVSILLLTHINIMGWQTAARAWREDE